MNIIELRSISKTYPGKEKKANNNINLSLKKGEILCIAGENGAGKTTLMKILCGLEKPDSGDIYVNGEKKEILSPLAAKKLGIGMVHQHFMLFPEYTAAENIVMGMEPRKCKLFLDSKKTNEASQKIINYNSFNIKPAQKVKDLSVGEMQQVEICRILFSNAQIIIMDEPTSILTEKEASSLFKTLKKLASEGKSIILITHKLHEIKMICDRAAVLRRGELLKIYEKGQIDEYEIARLMTFGTGEDREYLLKSVDENVKRSFAIKKTLKESVIAFKNVTVKRHGQKRPLLDNVSFNVNTGEILGITGSGGNGLGVIEAVLGGFLHPSEGKILHKEKEISNYNIRALRNQGLAYVPCDRIRIGSARDATIEENLIINRRDNFAGSIFSKKKLKEKEEFSKNIIKNYNIEGAFLKEKASTLSGGNLQKLILAREISFFKNYIVFSEPSWGLDIASSNFIAEEIKKLPEKGAAVILISTDLDEILKLADRIIVMYRGRIAGDFINNSDLSIKEKIGNCMQGLIEGK